MMSGKGRVGWHYDLVHRRRRCRISALLRNKERRRHISPGKENKENEKELFHLGRFGEGSSREEFVKVKVFSLMTTPSPSIDKREHRGFLLAFLQFLASVHACTTSDPALT